MNNIIKNEYEYNSALEEVERLMNADPSPDSEEGEKLHLLAVLIKDFEKDLDIMKFPDPISAIEFRMEQQRLNQRDLIPYIGSRSKVSEVLSGKRQLSIEMIRALQTGLKIPVDILIKEPKPSLNINFDFDKFPVKEIVKRNWLDYSIDKQQNNNEIILNKFLQQFQTLPQFQAFHRANNSIRSGKKMDIYALYLWKLRILQIAQKENNIIKYEQSNLTKDFLRELVKLSIYPDGPIKAIDSLKNIGIIVAIEPHLLRTYLDGAAIFIEESNPVIGLSIRFDRVDNFWFTLMHELAHIYLHYYSGYESFFDDLEVRDENDKIEFEADEFARDILIPRDEWYSSPASKIKFPQAAEDLARKLNIHPAIVAGRMRYEFNAYRLLNNLIGSNQIRKLFHNIVWS